jgi:hypothetical protein
MAHLINWNPEEKIPAIVNASMEILEAACNIIRDDAKQKLKVQLRGNWREHGPYASGKYAGKIWTAREKAAMVRTIRVVRRKDATTRNIWIMAGNFKDWWAVQMEYGHGAWKGGARPFFRSAIKGSEGKVKALLESGGGQTKQF